MNGILKRFVVIFMILLVVLVSVCLISHYRKADTIKKEVYAEDKSVLEEDTKPEKNIKQEKDVKSDKTEPHFRKSINIDLPSGFELGEYIEGLEEDSRAIGGMPIYAREKKNKLEDEAINEEWNHAGLILVWDHSRFEFDNKDIVGMIGGMHAEIAKKPEKIKTESGNLISFEIEKDLYTAAGQAELEKRGIKTDYTAHMTAIILDYETDSDYAYAVFFNQKYFDEKQAFEIAENISIN